MSSGTGAAVTVGGGTGTAVGAAVDVGSRGGGGYHRGVGRVVARGRVAGEVVGAADATEGGAGGGGSALVALGEGLSGGGALTGGLFPATTGASEESGRGPWFST